MAFGKRLRDLRVEKKLRQEDLANIVKVHRATIGKYETEERFPDKDTLLALADYFNVTVDYLLGRTDVRKPYTSEDLNSILREKESKDIQNLDIAGLPEEAVKHVVDYLDFIKKKYST
ncbi:MAG: helix-turn-helix domain-containing protein [Clostridia bacterium]|nr:helix-turn-helix domain-containing protein [Clostridia bacterium]